MSADAFVATVQPPVGGLNYRLPAIALDQQYALVLDNLLPRGSHVELREGYAHHCENIPGQVVSIASYVGKTPAANRIFAFNNHGEVYDVTNRSKAPARVMRTAQIDGVWESVNTAGIDENYLVMVSPAGGYWTYSERDGFKQREITSDGKDKRFATVFNWKDRVWLIEDGSTRAYYLGVGAIQGEASEYDFYAVINRGGFLLYGCNWTFNAGYDIDDYLVLVTSQGEVLIYKGTNPDAVESFALEGVWYVGEAPAGRRSFTNFGGEMFITSSLGIVPISKLVNGQVANDYQTASAAIQPVFIGQFNADKTRFGWELEMIYNQQFLLVKTPEDQFGMNNHYVLNVTTGAWATISGMPMLCTTQIGNELYFGTADGLVCKGFTGDSDGEDLSKNAGKPIMGRYLSGYSDFDSPANVKTFQMAKPTFVSYDAPSVGVRIFTRYEDVFPLIEAGLQRPSSAIWNKDYWNRAYFGGSNSTFSPWIGLDGIGYYGALAISVTGKGKTQYISTTLTMKKGGVM
jgi:hypothetical protein